MEKSYPPANPVASDGERKPETGRLAIQAGLMASSTLFLGWILTVFEYWLGYFSLSLSPLSLCVHCGLRKNGLTYLPFYFIELRDQ